MQRINDISCMIQGAAKVGKTSLKLVCDDICSVMKKSSITSPFLHKIEMACQTMPKADTVMRQSCKDTNSSFDDSSTFQPKRQFSTFTIQSSNQQIFQTSKRFFHLSTQSNGLTTEQLAKLAQLKKVRQVQAEASKEELQKSVDNMQKQLNSRAKERRVPSTRVERLASFGGLAASLAIGTVSDATKSALGLKNPGQSENQLSHPLLNESNMNKIVETLCKVRGAALKLGQMLSIQDESVINPKLLEVFDRVRQSADFMPFKQIEGVLINEFGNDWRSKLKSFDEKPFAAASIGQVHRAVLHDGTEVAMKIQYPGVADSINSDIDNLVTLLKFWNFFPEQFYIDKFIDVTRVELAWECDYEREAKYSEEFRLRLKDEEIYGVPKIFKDLCGKRVITSELITGVTIDKVAELDQDTRNYVSAAILRLVLRELFEFKTMQTDPNWANFFYNEKQAKLWLLDFGATRTYSDEFVDSYIEVVKSAADGDREKVLDLSLTLGFLTGLEPQVMKDAHVDAIMILGEPFATEGTFDFKQQSTSNRIMKIIPTFLKHRLTPPPEESYSLHRKLSGAFLISTKLKAEYACKAMFDDVYQTYHNK